MGQASQALPRVAPRARRDRHDHRPGAALVGSARGDGIAGRTATWIGEIASDIAEARAAGLLVGSPTEAWGNAAIPGFGIGRPTELPDVDPEATPPEVVEPAAEPGPVDRYLIGDDELVIARGRGPLAIYAGSPAEAEAHHDSSFVLGVVGAVMSVLSIVAIGILLTGRLL